MTMAIPEAQKATEASFKKSTAIRVLGTDTTLRLRHPILHTVQPAPDAPAPLGAAKPSVREIDLSSLKEKFKF